jgi:hypothetical protein
MTRSLLLPLTVLVAALAVAGSASALSREGMPAALTIVRLDSAGTKTQAKTHTCQAGDTKEKTKARSAVVGTARKTAVVACEQPPRSSLLGPGLKQSAVNVLTALG